MRFIGDTHISSMSDLNRYFSLIKENSKSIQVGDFSLRKDIWDKLDEIQTNPLHKILGGNHEHYPSYHKSPNALGDFGTYENNMFFCRGAESIDSSDRKDGYQKFVDEELTYYQLNHVALMQYVTFEPIVMITHDCPQQVIPFISNSITDENKTRQAFDAMFDAHQPHFWIFGHHHRTRNFLYRKCNFICLAPWEIFDLDV